MRPAHGTARESGVTFVEMLPWVVGANALMTFGQTAYMLLSTRATKALKEIETLIKRLDKDSDERKTQDQAIVARIHLVEQRVLEIDAELKHLPSKDTVHKIEISLEQMKTELAKVASSADQSARTAARVETYLLERGK
jgi:septal ring factor EnvC (AmiA/AmiB activator)